MEKRVVGGAEVFKQNGARRYTTCQFHVRIFEASFKSEKYKSVLKPS